jgi:hypothetical protein
MNFSHVFSRCGTVALLAQQSLALSLKPLPLAHTSDATSAALAKPSSTAEKVS